MKHMQPYVVLISSAQVPLLQITRQIESVTYIPHFPLELARQGKEIVEVIDALRGEFEGTVMRYGIV